LFLVRPLENIPVKYCAKTNQKTDLQQTASWDGRTEGRIL
jgi:hypothetical protein